MAPELKSAPKWLIALIAIFLVCYFAYFVFMVVGD